MHKIRTGKVGLAPMEPAQDAGPIEMAIPDKPRSSRQKYRLTAEGDMNDIRRFSSRRQRLDRAFLSARLKGAQSYTRIAGNFRSSIFELVGEAIAAIPRVQIVCSSEMDATDVAVSKHVRATALKERLWKPGDPNPFSTHRQNRPIGKLLRVIAEQSLHEFNTPCRRNVGEPHKATMRRILDKDDLSEIFVHGHKDT